MDTLVTGLITVACCQLTILSQTIASVKIKNERQDVKGIINNIETKSEYDDVPYETLKKSIKHGNVIFGYAVLLKKVLQELSL